MISHFADADVEFLMNVVVGLTLTVMNVILDVDVFATVISMSAVGKFL